MRDDVWLRRDASRLTASADQDSPRTSLQQERDTDKVRVFSPACVDGPDHWVFGLVVLPGQVGVFALGGNRSSSLLRCDTRCQVPPQSSVTSDVCEGVARQCTQHIHDVFIERFACDLFNAVLVHCESRHVRRFARGLFSVAPRPA